MRRPPVARKDKIARILRCIEGCQKTIVCGREEEAGLWSSPASGLLLRFLCLGYRRRLYLAGAAHWTALAMILRMFGSKKTGLVSWPGWK